MKSNTNSMAQRKAAESEIKTRFERLQDSLTERSRRLFASSEALTFGYGGIAAFSRAIGLSQQTVRRGLWVSCQFWNLIAVDVLVVVGRN